MKYIKTIQRLKKDKEVNYSIVPKKLLRHLLSEELISVKHISASKKKVIVNNSFFIYYANVDDIDKASTRAELTKAKTDSKIKRIKPQDGLYIAGNCMVNNINLSLFVKSAMFLKELPEIDDDILVIGVENFENLIYAKEQFYLFEDKKILFVFRNKKMLEFFQNLNNNIIYFGDFDLAGISIYINEILPRNKTIKFFLPKEIKNYITEYGSKKLYEKQINKYKNLTSNIKEIEELIDFINAKQQALEQEFFIRKEKNG